VNMKIKIGGRPSIPRGHIFPFPIQARPWLRCVRFGLPPWPFVPGNPPRLPSTRFRRFYFPQAVPFPIEPPFSNKVAVPPILLSIRLFGEGIPEYPTIPCLPPRSWGRFRFFSRCGERSAQCAAGSWRQQVEESSWSWSSFPWCSFSRGVLVLPFMKVLEKGWCSPC
jgi:hypothetical protein